MKQILAYLKKNQGRFIDELGELLAIPSISTKTECAGDLKKAAHWVAEKLRAAGLPEVNVHQTKGNPVVVGHGPKVPGAPTVLIYGHYDVQPAEPESLWKTPPFKPTIKGTKLFARGAADDKGQLYIHVKVLEAFHEVKGAFPVNVKVLIEGEEEVGSPSLVPFLKQHKKELACDAVLISDTHMLALDTPSITTGLRGLTCVEINVRTSKGDQHSGTYGGTIANPCQVLAELLVACKDPKTGKIKVPGFYDDVRKLTPKQRKSLALTPHDDARYAKELGSPAVFGEKGFTTLERAGARPTFEINGIYGGYSGEGVKTVLPAEATAKISMRLVADQSPAKIVAAVRAHLAAIAPAHAKVTVRKLENDGQPVLVDPDFPGMRVASEAVQAVFGKPPILALEGGSIPIVSDFQGVLGAKAILLGFGLPDDNLHAPNEKIDLRMFARGTATVAHFLDGYARADR